MNSTLPRGPRYIVQGGAVLRGDVPISGAKNHALAAMCASLLTEDEVILNNVPEISDARSLAQLLTNLGAGVEWTAPNTLRLVGGTVGKVETPSELITENRASFQVMGPLLARLGRASSVPPGGDVIGQIDELLDRQGLAETGHRLFTGVDLPPGQPSLAPVGPLDSRVQHLPHGRCCFM